MQKNNNEKEVKVKIKLKNGYFISKVFPEKVIKETVKGFEYPKVNRNNKVGGVVEKRDSVCGSCGIF